MSLQKAASFQSSKEALELAQKSDTVQEAKEIVVDLINTASADEDLQVGLVNTLPFQKGDRRLYENQ